MSRSDLLKISEQLPETWRSEVVPHIGQTRLKVSRMDGTAFPAEQHPYTEGLLVLEGLLKLSIGNELIELKSGEFYLVPAETMHAVSAGSHGTLIILDL